jgi:uncharacterized protein (UPF0276 family)
VPQARIVQFHLAGHSDHGTYLLDTHDQPIREEVWLLYEHAVRRFGPTSTLIEWDDNIPEFGALMQIADEARDRATAALRMAGNPGYDARAHAGLVQTADCRP